MSTPRIRSVITPDSTGLEIGAARDALFSWLLARSRGGTFLLRNDAASFGSGPDREEDELRIIDDLLWLGLGWDEGIGEEGEHGPYRRAERHHLYTAAAEDLLQRGLAYICFCPPAGQEDSMTRTTCACRRISPGDAVLNRATGAASIRFRTGPGDKVGDFLLVRPDGAPGDEFATALDDALMRITHIVSGAGRPDAIARQVLIHAALNQGGEPVFIHLPPIGRQELRPALAEEGVAVIGVYRNEGYPPEAVLNFLAQLGAATNLGQELLTREEMLAGFDPSSTSRERPPVDAQQMGTLAKRHMARMSPERIADLAAEHLARAGLLVQPPSAGECAWAGTVARLYVGRLARMSDLAAAAELIFSFDPSASLSDATVSRVFHEPVSRRVIETLTEVLEAPPVRAGDDELTAVRFQAVVTAVRRASGAKGRDLYDALRIALTGRPDGPDLTQLIATIETGSRLELPRRVVGCGERARRLLEASATGES